MVRILTRTAESLATLFAIFILSFLILRLLPGGPFDEETALSPEVHARLTEQYGLGESWSTQLIRYLVHLLSGDLGESYRYTGKTVAQIFAETLPVSAGLGVFAFIFALLVGVNLGIIAGYGRPRYLGQVLDSMAVSMMSLPTIVVGPALIFVFSFKLDLLPAGLWGGFAHMILPLLTLSMRPIGLIMRFVSRMARDVLSEDFIRTARAKGVSVPRLLFKHTLRNTLVPVLTYAGPLLAELLTGAFAVEFIFAIPGLGQHFVESVGNRDYPLILSATLLFSSFLIFANWLVDVLTQWVDPRMELS